MIRSRAELAALLMKAARGAGLPLALAEDLYQMADYVSADDVASIAQDLQADGAALLALTNALDDVAAGQPLPDETPLTTAMAASRGWVLEDGVRQEGVPAKQSGPLDIEDAVLKALDALAARTYVPETAESRAKGAGAGAIDND